MASRYELVKKLATGGMAEVFLARAAGPGGFAKQLVVKRILPQLLERESVVRMFFAEARIAAQLTHPNIVQIFDFGEDEGAYFIAMEFIDGITLRALTRWAAKHDPLDPVVCARLVSLAAEGLGWAHEFADPETGQPLGLVHRDVSTDNIMVSRTGAVKVLDFGIVRVAGEDHGTQTGTLKGKISYMPREQILGLPLDGRADIYALGVVLFALLTGGRPYERDNDIALINAILNEPPRLVASLRPDVPEVLAAIVQRCLTQDRDERFQSCHELQHALERFIGSTGAVVTTAQLGQLVAAVRGEQSDGDRRTTSSQSGVGSSSGTGSRSGVGRNVATPLAQRVPWSAPEPRVAPGPVEQEVTNLDEQRAPPDAAGPDAPRPSQPERPAARRHSSSESRRAGSWQAVGAPAPAAPPAPSAPQRARVVPSALPAASPAVLTSAPPPQVAGGRGFRPGPPVPGMAPTWALSRARSQPAVVLASLKAAITSERATLGRRFFPIAASHMASAPSLLPQLTWHADGALAAALVSEDHPTLGWLSSSLSDASEQHRFGAWLRTQLTSPLTWLLLVEQLRRGPPADRRALQQWVGALGEPGVPLVMAAIEQLEPGTGQDLLCQALAAMLVDPTPVVERLETPNARHVAAWAQVLERHPSVSERKRVFARLTSRRDVPLTLALMTGRARVASAETLPLLEAGLGDRALEVRLKALELLAALAEPRVAHALVPHLAPAAFGEKTEEERAAVLRALASSNEPGVAGVILKLFEEKANLLNRKRLAQQRVPWVEALARAKGKAPLEVLEALAEDGGQPEEVRAAAAQHLLVTPAAAGGRLPPEQATRLRRLVVLELLMLARGALAVGMAAGPLDAALGRLREGLRQLVSQEGRFALAASADGVTVNGLPVTFTFDGLSADEAVAQAFAACDLRGFRVDGPVQLAELRAALLQLTDPEGTPEAAPHVDVTTWSGRALRPTATSAFAEDGGAQSAQVVAHALNFVREQRPLVAAGRMPPVVALEPLVRLWVGLARAGAWRVLALSAAHAVDRPVVHAVNTASIATAFAADLQLDAGALWKLVELGLLWPLGEASLPAEVAALPGTPMSEPRRLRVGLFLLAQLKHRRGPAASVTALEAGLEPPTKPNARSAGVVASILAMAEAWDALALEDDRGHAAALEVLRARHARRFAPELFGLFMQWAEGQRADG
jgi:serine/threonine protein kinase